MFIRNFGLFRYPDDGAGAGAEGSSAATGAEGTGNPDLLGSENNTNEAGEHGGQNNQAGEGNGQGQEGTLDLLNDTGEGQEGNGQQQQQAPDTYEAFQMPEGFEYNPESPEAVEFTALAKELNLTQEQAQKVVSLYGKRLQDSVANSTKQFQATVTGWVEDLKKDPEIGGNNWKANANLAARAAKQFGSPMFRELLRDTGLSNHPEFIRTFYKIAKAMGEDSFPGNNNGGGGRRLPPEEILYKG